LPLLPTKARAIASLAIVVSAIPLWFSVGYVAIVCWIPLVLGLLLQFWTQKLGKTLVYVGMMLLTLQ
jgi:hypothetical protein